jgi:hypothetical protein
MCTASCPAGACHWMASAGPQQRDGIVACYCAIDLGMVCTTSVPIARCETVTT